MARKEEWEKQGKRAKRNGGLGKTQKVGRRRKEGREESLRFVGEKGKRKE